MTREEAIRALEARLMSDDVLYVGELSYPQALTMAIEALKAHEPRVMTLEEVKEAAEQEKPMYVHEAKFPESTRWLIPKNAGHYGFEERGSHCQFHYYDYLSKQIGGFCCWTSRPTDEQREATPWAKT